MIYDFVEKVCKENLAPKITGMLMDLPPEDIKGYLLSYDTFSEKVRLAEALLNEK